MNMCISDLGLEDFNSYFINEDTRKIVKLCICGACFHIVRPLSPATFFSHFFLFWEFYGSGEKVDNRGNLRISEAWGLDWTGRSKTQDILLELECGCSIEPGAGLPNCSCEGPGRFL